MSWVGVAVIGGSLIGAVGSNMAAGKQAGAQEQAAATQQQMFNTITGNEQPFMQAGQTASSSLQQLLGLSGQPGSAVGSTGLTNGYLTSTFNPTQDQLNAYPGYQFALQTGGQATRNADTPGVGALSGAALKDLTNFDVGAASQNYGNYFNQYQTQQNNIFSRLSAIADLGQNAAGNVGNNGAQLGTGIAGSQAAAGSSLAAGTVGATNALSGGANSLASLAYLSQGNGYTPSNGTPYSGYASGISSGPTDSIVGGG